MGERPRISSTARSSYRRRRCRAGHRHRSGHGGALGMSDTIGPLAVLPADEQSQYPFGGPQVSPETKLVDAEVRRIVNKCYTVAIETLKAHREQLDALAEALLAKETLDEVEAYEVAGIARRERGDE